MRIDSRLSALALVLACGGSAATAPGAAPNTATTGVAMSADSLVVTLVADSSTVRSKQPVRMTVRVQNAGSTPQTIQVSSGCYFDYEVLSASGEVLGTSGQMCTQALGSRELKPGASFDGVLVWVPGQVGNVSPGAGQFSVRGVLLRSGAPVRSAAVPIRIAP